jgi:hypothetical protein
MKLTTWGPGNFETRGSRRRSRLDEVGEDAVRDQAARENSAKAVFFG